MGAASRLLDIYTEILGNIFSKMAIWILLGTLISIYSDTKKKAMVNTFLFSAGMLITYYAVAVITDGVYGINYIIGWSIFALCSPIFAYFCRMTKEKGVFPKVISFGVVAFSVFSSTVIFQRLGLDDLVIDGILIYFLFFKKIRREGTGQVENSTE